MKLEAGKYYKTRDGRKAGPILTFYDYFEGLVEGDPPKKGNRVWEADGSHSFFETNIDLVAEWTSMDIKIDGKYAYRKDPFTQVRILCVDRKAPDFTVVSMSEATGTLTYHNPAGRYNSSMETQNDLVPLREKEPGIWLVKFSNNSWFWAETKDKAEAVGECSGDEYKIIHYIPAPDQTA